MIKLRTLVAVTAVALWPAALLIAAAAKPATDVSEIKEIDFTGLTEAQRQMVLRVLNANSCNCGCNMTVSSCRRDMKNSCRRSLIFARTVVDAVREGKDEAAVTKTLQAKAATFVEAKIPDDTGVVYSIDVANAPFRGPKTAPVRIVEFSDFQCPYCAELYKTLDQVLKAFPKDVQLVYKQYPLNIHAYARQASNAALAAHSQGKFWEMHDKLFQNFAAINDANIQKWAKEIGLNMTDYDKAIQTGRFEPVIQKDMADGAAAKVLGTPTLFLNGRRLHDRSFEALKKAIQDEIATVRSASAAKAEPAKTAASPAH